MAKETEVQEMTFEDTHDGELEDDEYCFILGSDGELKRIFMPESIPFKTPKSVNKILRMFGITDPGKLDDNTLH